MGLTILTPTYNRAEMLKNVYNSLLKQTDFSFQWLVIDDGSKDDTAAIMQQIIDQHQASFSIEYYKKENGGKHTALNYAHPYIRFDWVTVLDSDDTLVERMVDTINKITNEYQNDQEIGWFAYLRGYTNDKPMGPEYQKNYDRTNYVAYMNNGRKGEVLDIYRTSVFKNYPYPQYTDERFVSESYLNIRAAVYGKYKMITVNDILYLADYQEGGYTKEGRKLQLSSPKGHADLWAPVCFKGFSLKQSIKGTWLHIAYALMGKQTVKEIINNHDQKWFVLLNIPFGYMIQIIWKKKYQM
ncbi:MAG: hypothetical protein PWR19_1994 [Carnobacterium sp.]|uniref:glycosyltransferase family 2 protein n=1 Tax=Carnobacterium sp. TaxID=48221 RepID=UPI002649CC73|nr:glycosyltransferase family A protein [Carnobacterium sp.]MDN5372948.1 hypothetical protein [Carnobacterium sp.]